MKRIAYYLLQGFLYLAPISVTIYILWLIFDFTDHLLLTYIEEYIQYKIPGLGILLVLIVLLLAGLIGQSILAKPFIFIFRNIIENTPLLKVIYSALKDLFSAFVGKERKYNKPVMVTIDKINSIKKIGFLTEENLDLLGEKDHVAVYLPFSYTFSGVLNIVHTDNIKVLDMPPADAMKFVMSGGVSGLNQSLKQEKNLPG